MARCAAAQAASPAALAAPPTQLKALPAHRLKPAKRTVAPVVRGGTPHTSAPAVVQVQARWPLPIVQWPSTLCTPESLHCAGCPSGQVPCGTGCITSGTCCATNPTQGTPCTSPQTCQTDGGTCGEGRHTAHLSTCGGAGASAMVAPHGAVAIHTLYACIAALRRLSQWPGALRHRLHHQRHLLRHQPNSRHSLHIA